MNHSRLYLFFLLLMLAIAWLSPGCKKEYSFEGGDTLVIIRDTTTPPVIPLPAGTFPGCSLCRVEDTLSPGTWSFKTGNTLLCGGITNAGFIGGKTTLTFFGPSACAADTGLVMTIYLPIALEGDRFNITAAGTAFYYYDNHASKDIFISRAPAPFSATIQSFISATSIAAGAFSGTVFKADGDTAFISEGRFKVLLK